MEATSRRNEHTGDLMVSVSLSPKDEICYAREVWERAITMTATRLADQFIAEHAQEVLAAIKPEAVATLTAAEAAAGIREALHTKFPDKIVEIVKREYVRRGLFG